MFADPRVAAPALRTERFEAALLAAERRVNRDPLADWETANSLAEYGHLAKQLVTRDDRQFEVWFRRRHRFPLQKTEVTPADPSNFAPDYYPIVVGQVRDRNIRELEVRQTGKVLRGELILMALSREEKCFHKSQFQLSLISVRLHSLCKFPFAQRREK
jgi:hypothetical protein